jgi:hypothetical protein
MGALESDKQNQRQGYRKKALVTVGVVDGALKMLLR